MPKLRGVLLFRRLTGGDKHIEAMFTGKDADSKCQHYCRGFENVLERVSKGKVNVTWWEIRYQGNPTPDQINPAIIKMMINGIPSGKKNKKPEPFTIPGF